MKFTESGRMISVGGKRKLSVIQSGRRQAKRRLVTYPTKEKEKKRSAKTALWGIRMSYCMIELTPLSTDLTLLYIPPV